MYRSLDLKVRDSVFDPRMAGGVIEYRRPPRGSPLYRVFLYLDGPDLPYVRRATYRLHPTFEPPVRTLSRTASNPNCMLQIWTWGVFEVEVTVEDKSGTTISLVHDLGYGREIEAAPQDRFKLVT